MNRRTQLTRRLHGPIRAALLAVVAWMSFAMPAWAAPEITAIQNELPSGNIQWMVFFDGNDGQNLPTAFDLEFTGDLLQVPALGPINVDDGATAFLYDGIGSYEAAEDTWIAAGTGTIWVVPIPSVFPANNGGSGGTAMLPGAIGEVFGTAAYAAWSTSGGVGQGPGATPIALIVVTPANSGTISVQGVYSRGAGGTVTVSETFPRAECANGEDDDGDGFSDLQDPGCANRSDPSETHLGPGDVLAAQVDGGIAVFHPRTTHMSSVADATAISSTWDVDVDVDGRILASNSSAASELVEIDVETGLGTVIASGGSITTPRGVVPYGVDSAFVSASGIDEIVSVELSTGTQTLVTSGAPFSQPQELLLDPSDGSLISADFGFIDIINDPLGSPSISTIATSFTSLHQIAFDGPTSLVVGDGASDIPHRIDLVTTVETPLLTFQAFNNLRGVAKEDDGLYLFSDFGDGKIVRVSEAADTATVLDPGSHGKLRHLAMVPSEYDLTLELTDALVLDGGTPGVADVGDTLELTAVVTNIGSGTADSLSLESGLDPNLTLVASSLTTTQGTIVEGSLASDPRLEVDLGSLAPAASATVTWEVDVSDPTPERSVSANAWVRREKVILIESDDPTTGPAGDANVIGVGDYGIVVQAVQKISDTRGELSGPGNPGSVLAAEEWFGGSLEPLGDIDGDGVDDLAVGAYEDDEAGPSFGAFYILLMNADGSVKQRFRWNGLSPDLTTAFSTAGLTLGDDRLGSAIAYLGDLDGAGPSDFALAVSAWYDDGGGTDRGAVYVMFMDQSPLQILSVSKIGDGVGGFPSGQLSDFDYFGNDVEAAGDIDGDGVVDLAVGVHLDDTIGVNSGGVWILFLTQSGTVKASPPVQILVSPAAAEDFVGLGIASLGLFDGDAVPDLAVSASRRDVGGPDRGAVWILTLNSNGTIKTQTEISPGVGGLPPGLLENDDRFGRDLEVLPDLDGDGTVELVVGANRDSGAGDKAGAVYALFLTPAGTTDKVVQLAPQPGVLFDELDADDRLGLAIAPLGDLDGNGDIEIAVSAMLDDDGGTNAGSIYILNTATPVPEPSGLLGLGSGILMLHLLDRRRRRP